MPIAKAVATPVGMDWRAASMTFGLTLPTGTLWINALPFQLAMLLLRYQSYRVPAL
jgi:hypothetical protein